MQPSGWFVLLRDDELNDLLSLFRPDTRVAVLMDWCIVSTGAGWPT